MTINQLIKTLTTDQVDTWWDQVTPEQVPQRDKNINWKYYLKKNDKIIEFKWGLRDLALFHQFELSDFSSNIDVRDSFCAEFNFSIHEKLIYDNTELKQFKKAYDKIKNKNLLQDFISYAYSVISDISIERYKVRMAIKNRSKFMVVVGMRECMSYFEKDNITYFSFVIGKQFYEAQKTNIDFSFHFKFVGDPSQDLIEVTANKWQDIPESLLLENKKQIKSQYNHVKDGKISNWNKEANTTNGVVKYLMFKNENIEEWIKTSQINQYEMDFFNDEDFNILAESLGKKYDKNDTEAKRMYDFLKITYKKNEFWAKEITTKLFPKGFQKTNKKPTNQANNFDGYLWSKIYPSESDYQDKWLAYVVAISDHGFDIKIDTVGYSNDEESPRKEYLKYAQENDIIKKYPKSQFSNWEELINQTLIDFKSFEEDFNRIKLFRTQNKNFNLEDLSEKGLSKNINPINQILYGPPGTGKTYYLKDQLFDKYTSKETSISKEQHFETIVSNCSWWQVIALALLDLKKAKVSNIFENKWVQKKASLSNSKTIRPTLWGQLQSHTVEECEFVNVNRRMQPLLFNKTEDSQWEILEDQVEEIVPELFDLRDSVENYNPDPDKIINHYDFVTFHQSFAYEDFIEGIKPIIPENGEETTDLGYSIEDGVFKNLCKKAKNDPGNKYAIFIDEINRGNVSAIFGELITLIEIDKRAGAKNELSIKLPYSKKEFSVPSNLDIYGTMNTADRSVEALDSALRRRFEFKEMMPQSELLLAVNNKGQKEFYGYTVSEILNTINNRIEVLIDRDHVIGHSYFFGLNNEEALLNVFTNKIIPLLQEYFYNDYSKIGLVLGSGFVEKKKVDNSRSIFAKFENSNTNNYVDIPEETYNLKSISLEEFGDAIKRLME